MNTLNDFFNTHPNSKEWANNVAELDGFTQAKTLLSQQISDTELSPAVYETLILKLCEALNLKIGTILVGGYRKHQEILSYRDKENPPAGYHTVNLIEHSISSTHEPALQPKINGVLLPNKLVFLVTLKLTIKGGNLFIQDGSITQITTGEVFGSGSIEYEGIQLLERKTASYDLPGSMVIDPPIKI